MQHAVAIFVHGARCGAFGLPSFPFPLPRAGMEALAGLASLSASPRVSDTDKNKKPEGKTPMRKKASAAEAAVPPQQESSAGKAKKTPPGRKMKLMKVGGAKTGVGQQKVRSGQQLLKVRRSLMKMKTKANKAKEAKEAKASCNSKAAKEQGKGSGSASSSTGSSSAGGGKQGLGRKAKLTKVGGATVKGSGKMVKMKQSSERADGEAVSSDGLSVTSSGVKEVVKETVKVIQEIPLRVLVCSGGMTPGIQAGDDQIRQNWKSHVAWSSQITMDFLTGSEPARKGMGVLVSSGYYRKCQGCFTLYPKTMGAPDMNNRIASGGGLVFEDFGGDAQITECPVCKPGI